MAILLIFILVCLIFTLVFYLGNVFFGKLFSGEAIEEKKEQAVREGRMKFAEMFEKAGQDPKSRQSMKLRGALFLGFFFLIAVSTSNPFFGFIAGCAGFYLPVIYAKIKEAKRLELIDQQLADGLLLISSSLKSGLSFAQGIEVMSQQGPKPLAEEFLLLSQELKLGVPMDTGLNNVAIRLSKSKEIKVAVTAINIARETGGSMSETLSQISETMRKRNEMKGKIMSLTAQGRFSGIIMSILPFALALAVYAIDPKMMMPMFTTVYGYIMLSFIVILIIIGSLIISRIVAIDI